MASHEDLLRSILQRSPIVSTVADRWPEIGLPDGWLAAGCLAQTVWNDAFGLPATHGLSEIDLVTSMAAISRKRRRRPTP